MSRWGRGVERTTVDWRFTPRVDGSTFVEITETGYSGDADQAVAPCGRLDGGGLRRSCPPVKALLEHDVVLTVVADRFPKDLDAGRDTG